MDDTTWARNQFEESYGELQFSSTQETETKHAPHTGEKICDHDSRGQTNQSCNKGRKRNKSAKNSANRPSESGENSSETKPIGRAVGVSDRSPRYQNHRHERCTSSMSMQELNELSPSKPSASSSFFRMNQPVPDSFENPVKVDSSQAGSVDEDDIEIHTDNDSEDSGDFLNVREWKRKDSASKITKPSISQPQSAPETMKSRTTRRRRFSQGMKNRRLSRRTKRGLLHRGRVTRMTVGKSRKESDDSEWESVTDSEMPESTVEQTAPTKGKQRKSSEEIQEHRIPMKRQLEKTIAKGSAKNKLSVSNVKSILRSLITNDLVKGMLRSTLKETSEELPDELVVYEPKLTRSKVKEVLQKEKVPKLWPVSPIKLGQPATAGPSILDVEFPDEEDDEYEPTKDLEEADSDDESLASLLSDGGSPFPFGSPSVSLPSTPTTPRTPARDVAATASLGTPVAGSSASASLMNRSRSQPELERNPMGPPLPPGPVANSTKKRLVFTPTVQRHQEAEDDGIARRTRSKLPLTTTSLNDIEEAFVAPDITPDMYDTTCDDTEWQEFLKSLHHCEGTDIQNESTEVGEEDDPEFNYIAEAEQEEMEAEEDLYQAPFRVSRKELNTLMEELEDLFNDDYTMIGMCTLSPVQTGDLEKQADTPAATDGDTHNSSKVCFREETQTTSAPKRFSWKDLQNRAGASPPVEPADNGRMILDHQIRQLEKQLRQHVQLTTQMYILSQGMEGYRTMAEDCRKIVKEINTLQSRSVAGPHSAFKTCNLTGALEIVDADIDWESHGQLKGRPVRATDEDRAESAPGSSGSVGHKEKRPRKCLEKFRRSLLPVQKELMWRSPVFLYPSLLPRQGLVPPFALEQVRPVNNFSGHEELLLILGIEQFKHLGIDPCFQWIHKLLIPCKSVRQIKKRFNRSIKLPTTKNNVVTKYKMNGEVPEIPRDDETFSVDMVKAPCDQPLSLLPKWCKVCRIHDDAKKRRQAQEDKFKKGMEESRRRHEEKRRKRNRRLDAAYKTGRKRTANTDRRSGVEVATESDLDGFSEPPAKVPRRSLDERSRPSGGEQSDSYRSAPVSLPSCDTSSAIISPYTKNRSGSRSGEAVIEGSSSCVSEPPASAPRCRPSHGEQSDLSRSAPLSLPTSEKPTAIITPSNIYVPLHFGDILKVSTAVAQGQLTASQLDDHGQVSGSAVPHDGGPPGQQGPQLEDRTATGAPEPPCGSHLSAASLHSEQGRTQKLCQKNAFGRDDLFHSGYLQVFSQTVSPGDFPGQQNRPVFLMTEQTPHAPDQADEGRVDHLSVSNPPVLKTTTMAETNAERSTELSLSTQVSPLSSEASQSLMHTLVTSDLPSDQSLSMHQALLTGRQESGSVGMNQGVGPLDNPQGVISRNSFEICAERGPAPVLNPSNITFEREMSMGLVECAGTQNGPACSPAVKQAPFVGAGDSLLRLNRTRPDAAGTEMDQTLGAVKKPLAGSCGTLTGQVVSGSCGTLTGQVVSDSCGTLAGQVVSGSCGTLAVQVVSDSCGTLTGQVVSGSCGTLTGQVVSDSCGTLTGQVVSGSCGTLTGQVVSDSCGTLTGQVVSDSCGTLAGQVVSGSCGTLTGQVVSDSCGTLTGQVVSDSCGTLTGQVVSDSCGTLTGQVVSDSCGTLTGQVVSDSCGTLTGQVVSDSCGTLTGQAGSESGDTLSAACPDSAAEDILPESSMEERSPVRGKASDQPTAGDQHVIECRSSSVVQKTIEEKSPSVEQIDDQSQSAEENRTQGKSSSVKQIDPKDRCPSAQDNVVDERALIMEKSAATSKFLSVEQCATKKKYLSVDQTAADNRAPLIEQSYTEDIPIPLSVVQHTTAVDILSCVEQRNTLAENRSLPSVGTGMPLSEGRSPSPKQKRTEASSPSLERNVGGSSSHLEQSSSEGTTTSVPCQPEDPKPGCSWHDPSPQTSHLSTDETCTIQRTPDSPVMPCVRRGENGVDIQLNTLQQTIQNLFGGCHSDSEGRERSSTERRSPSGSPSVDSARVKVVSQSHGSSIDGTAPEVSITVNVVCSSCCTTVRSSRREDLSQNPSSTTPGWEEEQEDPHRRRTCQCAEAAPVNTLSPVLDDSVSSTSGMGENSDSVELAGDESAVKEHMEHVGWNEHEAHGDQNEKQEHLNQKMEQEHPNENEEQEHPNQNEEQEHPNVDEEQEHPNVNGEQEHPNVNGEQEHPNVNEEQEHPNVNGEQEHPNVNGEQEHPNVNGEQEHPDQNEEQEHPNQNEEQEHPNQNEEQEHPNQNEEQEHPNQNEEQEHPNQNDEQEHPNQNEEQEHPNQNEEQEHRTEKEEQEHSNENEEQEHPNQNEEQEHANQNEQEQLSKNKQEEYLDQHERKYPDQNKQEEHRHRNKQEQSGWNEREEQSGRNEQEEHLHQNKEHFDQNEEEHLDQNEQEERLEQYEEEQLGQNKQAEHPYENEREKCQNEQDEQPGQKEQDEQPGQTEQRQQCTEPASEDRTSPPVEAASHCPSQGHTPPSPVVEIKVEDLSVEVPKPSPRNKPIYLVRVAAAGKRESKAAGHRLPEPHKYWNPSAVPALECPEGSRVGEPQARRRRTSYMSRTSSSELITGENPQTRKQGLQEFLSLKNPPASMNRMTQTDPSVSEVLAVNSVQLSNTREPKAPSVERRHALKPSVPQNSKVKSRGGSKTSKSLDSTVKSGRACKTSRSQDSTVKSGRACKTSRSQDSTVKSGRACKTSRSQDSTVKSGRACKTSRSQDSTVKSGCTSRKKKTPALVVKFPSLSKIKASQNVDMKVTSKSRTRKFLSHAMNSLHPATVRSQCSDSVMISPTRRQCVRILPKSAASNGAALLGESPVVRTSRKKRTPGKNRQKEQQGQNLSRNKGKNHSGQHVEEHGSDQKEEHSSDQKEEHGSGQKKQRDHPGKHCVACCTATASPRVSRRCARRRDPEVPVATTSLSATSGSAFSMNASRRKSSARSGIHVSQSASGQSCLVSPVASKVWTPDTTLPSLRTTKSSHLIVRTSSVAKTSTVEACSSPVMSGYPGRTVGGKGLVNVRTVPPGQTPPIRHRHWTCNGPPSMAHPSDARCLMGPPPSEGSRGTHPLDENQDSGFSSQNCQTTPVQNEETDAAGVADAVLPPKMNIATVFSGDMKGKEKAWAGDSVGISEESVDEGPMATKTRPLARVESASGSSQLASGVSGPSSEALWETSSERPCADSSAVTNPVGPAPPIKEETDVDWPTLPVPPAADRAGLPVSCVNPTVTTSCRRLSGPDIAGEQSQPSTKGSRSGMADKPCATVPCSKELPDPSEEDTGLPTISSPMGKIQRGSFAGLLRVSRSSSLGGSGEDVMPDSGAGSSPSSCRRTVVQKEGTHSTTPSREEGQHATALPMPLMSDDTMNDLFSQMRETGTRGCVSVSLGFSDNAVLAQDVAERALPEGGSSHTERQSPPVDKEHTDRAAQDAAASSSSFSTAGENQQHGETNEQDIKWTKEQDKLILEMVRDYGDTPDTCHDIAVQLQTVTSQQVSERLSVLLELLERFGETEDVTSDEDL